jgi:hypothetical protein
MEMDMRMEVSRAMAMVLLWPREKQGRTPHQRRLFLRSLDHPGGLSNRYKSRDHESDSSTPPVLPMKAEYKKHINPSPPISLLVLEEEPVTAEMWESLDGSRGGRPVTATIYFHWTKSDISRVQER